MYDKNQYIYFSAGSDNNPPVHKVIIQYFLLFGILRALILFTFCHFICQIEAEVEVYPKLNFTKAIIGGSLGGLAFLALLTASLYKVKDSFYTFFN